MSYVRRWCVLDIQSNHHHRHRHHQCVRVFSSIRMARALCVCACVSVCTICAQVQFVVCAFVEAEGNKVLYECMNVGPTPPAKHTESIR